MLTQENLPELLTALGFEKKGAIFKKTIGAAVIEVNTSKKEISYPEAAGLVINERQTCNFEANENFVVLDCSWKDGPQGKIQKFDVVVAKNYLTEHEMAQLQRLVSAYLDVAEDMALRKIPMTMQDWETRLNRFIEATDRDVLQDAGKVTAEIAKAHAMSEFEKYRIVQDRLFESDFDRVIKRLESGSEPDIAEE